MESLRKKLPGILVCLVIAIPSYLLGKFLPVVGGAIFSILIGMVIATFWKEKGKAAPGIKFTSKFVLQLAVVLLGFGLNLNVIMQTGKQSLPIIICTIATSLITAFVLHKALSIHKNTSVLIGVGSSICGGSAIAATAPVIDANDEEVAQSISVIFFFNVLAAIIFPILGKAIGFDTLSGDAFGIFAGTAVNDTSSVTAAAATWDSMWNLGTQTLDKAVTVKLTRTLAIIPITLVLAIHRAKKEQAALEERILKLENMTRVAVIIDENNVNLDIITIGSIVKIYDEDFDEELEYTIVGSAEADPYDGKISNESPVGKALLGRAKGDVVEVTVPDGIAKLKVVDIKR